MKMTKVKNLTQTPVGVRVADGKLVWFVPTSVVVKPELGAGTTQLPTEVWDELKKDPRIARRLDRQQMVELGG